MQRDQSGFIERFRPSMPVPGITTLTCPACDREIPSDSCVSLDELILDVPRLTFQTEFSFRCPACDHEATFGFDMEVKERHQGDQSDETSDPERN